MKIDQKFRNRLSDYLFKNNMLLFSRTIDCCFPIVFRTFLNPIIPKQGIERQIFFLKGVVEILKKWAPTVKFKCLGYPNLSWLEVLFSFFPWFLLAVSAKSKLGMIEHFGKIVQSVRDLE